MFRFAALAFTTLAVVAVDSFDARAQDSALRGSLDEPRGASLAQDPQEAVDATQSVDTGDVTDAGEAVEPLARSGRVGPVQPFSERLRAIQRQTAVNGGGTIDLSVYDGETLRDAPEGLRAGTFLLFPELLTTLGWSDNREGDSAGTSGLLYRIAPSVRIQSDWARHSLGINVRGSYTAYPSSDIDPDPSGNADALLRLDLGDQTELETQARYALSIEDRGTAESVGGDREIHELGGGLALRRTLGVIQAELRGQVDSTIYSDDDDTASNRQRDNALYTASLRVNAQTGAHLQPFVEGSVFRRHYFEDCADLTQCADRNSVGYGLRAGVTFDNGGKISGDFGLGWRSEKLDDDRLDRLEGLTVDGSLVWSPTRLTTLTSTLSTGYSTSTISGTPGSVVYSGDLRIAHGFTDALAGEVGMGLSRRDYTGIELTEDEARATAALTYAITRNIALQGRYTFRRFSSSTQGAGYSENAIEAGLRFRH